MQREFIKYNRELLGKRHIFGGVDESDQKIKIIDDPEREDTFYEEEDNNTRISSTKTVPNSVQETDSQKQGDIKEEEDDIDPLEAYMRGIDEQMQMEPVVSTKSKSVEVMERDVIDYESLVKGEQTDFKSSDPNIIYDEDGKPQLVKKNEVNLITTVKREDFYEPFTRDFYPESLEAINDDILKWEKDHSIEVHNLRSSGSTSYQVKTPHSCLSFKEMGFPDKLLNLIQKHNYSTPTPIQSSSLPLILSGRNVIGSSPTGSGKTYCFLWPLIIHILAQKPLEVNDGPIGIILVPTRELAEQINTVIHSFTSSFGITHICITGGQSEWQQKKTLFNQSFHVIIGTPGRFIELINQKYLSLNRITYAVFDEADRMISMGFEQQIRSLLSSIRTDIQLILFSATFPLRIVQLLLDIMIKPVRVSVGHIGIANIQIKQEIIIFKSYHDKIEWIKKSISQLELQGKILIFVSTRVTADELTSYLHHVTTASIDSLHGDKQQYERSEVISRLKNGSLRIVIATDVAARGLDVPDITTSKLYFGIPKIVINFDVPHSIDIYIHRIGRCCRTVNDSKEGTAITLFTSTDSSFASQLVKYFRGNEQEIPFRLEQLAKSLTGRSDRQGNSGLGFKDSSINVIGTKHDLFAGYYEKNNEKNVNDVCNTNDINGVVMSTESDRYETIYIKETNTYTTIAKSNQISHSIGIDKATITTTTAVKGFVSGCQEKKGDLPLSGYGGPDDEWDSSKMALESALAAIRARKGTTETERQSLRQVRETDNSHSHNTNRYNTNRHNQNRRSRSHDRRERYNRHDQSHSRSHSRSRHSNRSHNRRSRSRSRSQGHHSHKRH